MAKKVLYHSRMVLAGCWRHQKKFMEDDLSARMHRTSHVIFSGLFVFFVVKKTYEIKSKEKKREKDLKHA